MNFWDAFHNLQKLQFKKALRKDQTPAESALWEALRNRRLNGMKWRRQANIGPFFADFLCVEHRLIIEVDGEIHESQQEKDQFRTEFIGDYDYRVIRFKNEEVLFDVQMVLKKIADAVKK